MYHRARVAVEVEHKVVHNEIADDGIDIDGLLRLIARERFESGNEPLFVRRGHIGLGVVEDIRVAVGVVVNVF